MDVNRDQILYKQNFSEVHHGDVDGFDGQRSSFRNGCNCLFNMGLCQPSHVAWRNKFVIPKQHMMIHMCIVGVSLSEYSG